MAASELIPLTLPDWYRIERETEKTISRLETVKELDYYLCNPDEFVRRLGILRLQKIAVKESSYVLKEIVDNPVETSENKYLAAWALNSILRKKDSDLFLSSKYLGKFNGNERFEDLFPVITEETCSPIRFDFTSNESYAALKLDNEDTALERDVFFETSFDFKQWMSIFSSALKKSILSAIKAIGLCILGLPILISKGLATLIKKLSQLRKERKEAKAKIIEAIPTLKEADKPKESKKIKESKKLKEIRKQVKSQDYQIPVRKDAPGDYTGLRSNLYRKAGILSLVKKVGFQMLYFLFAPLRLIRRYKFVLLCFLILAYLVLAYTEYGRAFTNKYIAFDMRNTPKIVLQKAREYSMIVLTGLNKLTGLDEYRNENTLAASKDIMKVSNENVEKAAAEGKLYQVTAQKGLNMRSSPDPKSQRVGSEPLAYGSIVIYLSKSESDSSGSVWYYVETRDGRSGWVSSRYLKEGKVG